MKKSPENIRDSLVSRGVKHAKSWSVDARTIDPATYDLSVKNPNGGEAIAHRSPADIIEEIAALDAESAEVLNGIRKLL